jgi:hypothetical protein
VGRKTDAQKTAAFRFQISSDILTCFSLQQSITSSSSLLQRPAPTVAKTFTIRCSGAMLLPLSILRSRVISNIRTEAMSVSDENTPPFSEHITKAHHRRRTSSLFQVEGTSLLDTIQDNYKPILHTGSPKVAAVSESPIVQGGQHQADEKVPAPVNAATSNLNSINVAAAEAFELWDSHPTNFPRPTFIFTGNMSPYTSSSRVVNILHLAVASRCARALTLVLSTSFPPAAPHSGTITVAAAALIAIFFMVAVSSISITLFIFDQLLHFKTLELDF